MSKITLEPNSSGAGTFSIVSPDSNTNRTLNLPDASGNIIAADASTGRFDSSNMPAGSVIQVVSTTKTDTFSTNSGSFTDVTGMSASIAPTKVSNKVLIMLSFRYGNDASGTCAARLDRNGTPILLGPGNNNNLSNVHAAHSGTIQGFGDYSVTILDEPSTTSPQTYGLQVKRQSGTLFVNNRNDGISDTATRSSITLMEIAG